MNKFKYISFLLMAFVAVGCAAKLSVVKNLNYIPGERTLNVVVLPFLTKTVQGEEVVAQVREEVTANLQEGNFNIAELVEVDQFLSEKGLDDSSDLVETIRTNNSGIAEAFDADIFVQGRILEWTKTYLAIHSDVELDMELFVFDAKTGKMIAKVRRGVIRNSGISRLPISYVTAGTAPLMGLMKSVQQDVIHTLAREISEPLVELNEKPTI